MSVLFKSTKLDNIKDVLMKLDGKVINNLPLKMKMGSTVVSFIQYGPTKEEIKMLVEVKPEGFNATTLSRVINSLADVVDTVVVKFSAGTFYCYDTLIIKRSNVSLIGEGRNTIITHTMSSGNIIKFEGKKNGSELENLYVSHITFDGGDTGSDIYDNLFACEFVGKGYLKSSNTPIYSSNTGSGNICKKGITIENCIIQKSKGNGITLRNTNSSVINSTVCQNNGNRGINLEDSYSYNIIVSNNIVQNNNGEGIESTNSSNNVISDNIIQNNNKDGICTVNSFGDKILNNTLQNNGRRGISLLNFEHDIINNNSIHSNVGTGIFFYNGSNLINNTIVKSNNIHHNGGCGIQLDRANLAFIISNMITDNNSNCIESGSCCSLVILNNNFYGNKLKGISESNGTSNYSNYNFM